jgi:uncharacterized protein (DUF1330 family)
VVEGFFEGAVMPAYVLVHIDVKDPEPYEEYKKMAPASIAQYGGRYIVRGPKPEILEGSWDPKRLVILEFPSVERAREWWNSPEYADAKAKRQSCSSGEMVLLEGL